MTLILFFIAALANGMMDLIDMKPKAFDKLPMNGFRVWLLGNGVYYKKWMYPFFTFMKDGWHFFKGIMVLCFTLAIAADVLQGFVLFFIWMVGHEVIFASR